MKEIRMRAGKEKDSSERAERKGREIEKRDRAERRERVERICASLYTSVKNKIDHIF